MKNLKSFLVLFMMLMTVGVFAQNLKKDLAGTFDKLDEKQQMQLLMHAFENSDVDVKKQLLKVFKKMKPVDQKAIFGMAQNYADITSKKEAIVTSIKKKQAPTQRTTKAASVPPAKSVLSPQSKSRVAATTKTTPTKKRVKPAAPAAPVGPTTTMEFENTTYEFGVISSGEKVAHTYKFRNTGTEPLLITNAKGSCGCTVPKWPKEAIAPGESGSIEVVFNSKGKKGKQAKRITLTANTEPVQTFLTIKGEVIKEEN